MYPFCLQERNKFRARRSKRTQSLKHSFKKVSVIGKKNKYAGVPHNHSLRIWTHMGECCHPLQKVTRGYKDGLQPESLADGNWLVKQNQPVSKIETISDTNLRSLYESWFRSALISKSVILWWQAKKGINSELEGANTRRVLNLPTKRSLYLMRSSHTSAHLQKKSTCLHCA